MFKTVIVGVDGRPGGRDAIALARHLAAEDASIAIAYVYQGDVVPARGSSGAFEAGEKDRAQALLEAERRETGIEARALAVGAPGVGRGLHELAEREAADLLVVGSSTRGLVGRVTASDDTRAALNGARCAVAVAPAGYAERAGELREIGVGYDGSPQSAHALEVARQLAAEHGAKLSAFQAVSVPSYALVGGADAIGEALSSYVASALEEISALAVEPHAAYGVPAEEARALRRVGRSARDRLTRLRSDRSAPPRQYRAPTCRSRALPAARADPRRHGRLTTNATNASVRWRGIYLTQCVLLSTTGLRDRGRQTQGALRGRPRRHPLSPLCGNAPVSPIKVIDDRFAVPGKSLRPRC